MKIRPKYINYRREAIDSVSDSCFRNDLIIDGCFISDDDNDLKVVGCDSSCSHNFTCVKCPLSDHATSDTAISESRNDSLESSSIPSYEFELSEADSGRRFVDGYDSNQSRRDSDITLSEVTQLRPSKKRRKLPQSTKIRQVDRERNLGDEELVFLSHPKELSQNTKKNHDKYSESNQTIDSTGDESCGITKDNSRSMNIIGPLNASNDNKVDENIGQSQDVITSLTSMHTRYVHQLFEPIQFKGCLGITRRTVPSRQLQWLTLSYCKDALMSGRLLKNVLRNHSMFINQYPTASLRFDHLELPYTPVNECTSESPSSTSHALVVYKPPNRIPITESQLSKSYLATSVYSLTAENIIRFLYFLFITYGHQFLDDNSRHLIYNTSDPMKEEQEQSIPEHEHEQRDNEIEIISSKTDITDMEIEAPCCPSTNNNGLPKPFHYESETYADRDSNLEKVSEISQCEMDNRSHGSEKYSLQGHETIEAYSSSSEIEDALEDEANIPHEWNEYSYASTTDSQNSLLGEDKGDRFSWKHRSPHDSVGHYSHCRDEYSFDFSQEHIQGTESSVLGLRTATNVITDVTGNSRTHHNSNDQEPSRFKAMIIMDEVANSKYWVDQSKCHLKSQEACNQSKRGEQEDKLLNHYTRERIVALHSGSAQKQKTIQDRKRKRGTLAANQCDGLSFNEGSVNLIEDKNVPGLSSSREVRKDTTMTARIRNEEINLRSESPADVHEDFQQRSSIETNILNPPNVDQHKIGRDSLSTAAAVSLSNLVSQASQYSLLCAESFLETYCEAAAELCSGRWMQSLNLSHQGTPQGIFRINMKDTPFLDEIFVDIELGDYSAITIIDSSSLVHHNPTVIKDIVKRFVQLGSTGRYDSIHILLIFSNAAHYHHLHSNLALLSNAVFKQPGCPCQRFSVQFVSRETLAVSIVKIATSHGLFNEINECLNQDETFNSDFQLQVRFLLKIAPTLTCKNALLLVRGYRGSLGQLLHDFSLDADERNLAKLLSDRGIAGIRAISVRQLSIAMKVSFKSDMN